MADWSPLRAQLTRVDGAKTYDWTELDRLVGGLPRSAYDYPAFWSGARNQWSGFRATYVAVGKSVTFVRRRPSSTQPVATATSTPPMPTAVPVRVSQPIADILLITCVKTKLGEPAQARDLYVSELFRRERRYAESSGLPWFILSAEHGLVAPDEWLAPYERYLPDTPPSYQRTWGEWVAARLALLTGSLQGKTIELHASATYSAALHTPLASAGALVVEPLRGLAMGARLAWYGSATASEADASIFARLLLDANEAVSPEDFVARGAAGFQAPGLYSWWVDESGACDLMSGLGHPVEAGLIYAGLAGATKWPSGTQSNQTLWTRIKGNHIGGRHRGSTFRLTLGSVLAATRGWSTIDEVELTTWMNQHLRVLARPYDDADTLGQLEDDVLEAIDPPLNLEGMASTDLRKRLSELRRSYSDR